MIKERWYHGFIYLMTMSVAITGLAMLVGTPVKAAVCLTSITMFVFGAIFCFCEILVNGFTAKTGGFFWTAVVSILIARSII